eukprot:scaffold111233_cov67-Phaeocystis_antarctica.AAC.3
MPRTESTAALVAVLAYIRTHVPDGCVGVARAVASLHECPHPCVFILRVRKAHEPLPPGMRSIAVHQAGRQMVVMVAGDAIANEAQRATAECALNIMHG